MLLPVSYEKARWFHTPLHTEPVKKQSLPSPTIPHALARVPDRALAAPPPPPHSYTDVPLEQTIHTDPLRGALPVGSSGTTAVVAMYALFWR